MSYKWCAVPGCTNTTIKTPEKLFITVPKNVKIRNKWLQLARRNPKEIKCSSVIFFCQDHFNIEKDMANYYQYNMGLSKRIIMIEGVVPTKFYCQEDHRKRMSDASTSRHVFIKIEGTQVIQDSHGTLVQEMLNKPSPCNTQSTTTPFDTIEYKQIKEEHGTIEIKEEILEETVTPMEQNEYECERQLNTEIIIKDEIFIKNEILDENGEKSFDTIEYKRIKEEHDTMEVKEEILEETVTTDKQNKNEYERQLNTEIIIKDEKFSENVLAFHTKNEKNDKTFNWSENLDIYGGAQIEEKTFVCEICDKSFTHNYNLIRHKRMHAGEKPFSCDFCDKSFAQKTNLIKHKRTHSGEKPFSCDFCDKSFTQKITLNMHKRIHAGDKPFSCDFCDKSFTQKTTLIKHKRTHSGEKPFSCDFCDKSFTQKITLNIHKRIHAGEKPFSCDFCDKSFTQKTNLIKHKRTHSGEKPFSCELCNKSFIRNSDLTSHKRSHIEEKCEICDKSFLQKIDYIRHKKIHRGDKIFLCEVCNKSFTRNTNLNKHKRTQHIIKTSFNLNESTQEKG